MISPMRGAWCGLLLLLPPVSVLLAQDSATVVPDPAIRRGGLRRLLLGDHYRDLWTTPIRAPILDLSSEAGGLRPLRRGGGLQTRSLRFAAGNGREYVFRVMQKDPSRFLPEELRGTFAEGIVRDQMSAMHPGGALVVPPILEAAGVLHAPPRLVVMPDDARLGEFRAEFANQLGTLEERPTDGDDDTPAFAGARKLVDTPELIEELWKRPWVKVDAHAYLTARLLDLYVGDWDRHEDQWRWALTGGEPSEHWVPIPRDRDQAFARYDGVLLEIAREMTPQLLNFSEHYASPLAATWNGRNLDRRLLVELGEPVWDSTARHLQRVITDSVIDEAVGRLPAELHVRSGEWLRDNLVTRRAGLHEAAMRLYRFLARQVRIQAGDKDDFALVERRADGATRVRLIRREAGLYFNRLFDPRVTEEIVLDLRDGDDRLVVTGEGRGPFLRVIGGTGTDTLIDSTAARHSRFYDADDDTESGASGVNRKPYVQPADTNPAALPERDWGSQAITYPSMMVAPDMGFTFGYAWDRRRYGFRRQPYATSVRYGGVYSLGRSAGRANVEVRWKLINSGTYLTLASFVSGIEHLQFYGFGNDTEETEPQTFYRVRQDAYEFSPGIGFGLEGRSRFHLILRARHTVTDSTEERNRQGPIADLEPLGYGSFGQLGLVAKYEWDTRDFPMLPTRGVRLQVEAGYYPVTWSTGQDPFGTVEGTASTFLSPGGQEALTFTLRAGGRAAWGDFPYFEAAYLGGLGSLRGYVRNRFGGEAAAWGTVEARLRLFRTFIIVPGELGVFGLADAGRVWVDDAADSDTWHSNGGGGIYLSLLRRSPVFALGVAQGDEGARVYFGLGLGH